MRESQIDGTQEMCKVITKEQQEQVKLGLVADTSQI